MVKGKIEFSNRYIKKPTTYLYLKFNTGFIFNVSVTYRTVKTIPLTFHRDLAFPLPQLFPVPAILFPQLLQDRSEIILRIVFILKHQKSLKFLVTFNLYSQVTT